MIAYKLCSDIAAEGFLDGITRLIARVDADFKPALSSRGSLMLLQPGTGCGSIGIDGYVELLKLQKCIVALDGEQVVGAMFYQESFYPEAVRQVEPGRKGIYVTLAAALPGLQHVEVLRTLYQILIGLHIYETRVLIARTWSGAREYIHLLESMNFEEAARILNERGRGMDTSYYVAPIDAW